MKMFVKPRVVAAFLFIVHDCFKVASMYYCGDKMEWYNVTTHDCINNTVKRKMFMFCGEPPKEYNINRQACVDNSIVEKSETVENKVERAACRYERLTRHQRCCGDRVYEPRYQTCCSRKHMHIIHDHKPEVNHVCCVLEAYNRRSAEAACHKSAHNDQFFKPKKLRKVNKKICSDFDYVYRVSVKSQSWKKNRRFLRVIVSRFSWNPIRSRRFLKLNEKKRMRVRLDKYSGKRNLSGKSFVIFSDQIYTMGKIFKLRFREMVYTFPKRKSLQKIRRECKKLFMENKFSSWNG